MFVLVYVFERLRFLGRSHREAGRRLGLHATPTGSSGGCYDCGRGLVEVVIGDFGGRPRGLEVACGQRISGHVQVR